MSKNRNKYRIPNSVRLLFVGVLAFNLLWWVGAVIFQNKALPNPVDVYAIMPKTMKDGMLAHSVASLQRIVFGTLIALVIALLGGILTGLSKKANRLLKA